MKNLLIPLFSSDIEFLNQNSKIVSLANYLKQIQNWQGQIFLSKTNHWMTQKKQGRIRFKLLQWYFMIKQLIHKNEWIDLETKLLWMPRDCLPFRNGTRW